jgi:hypothetical protein
MGKAGGSNVDSTIDSTTKKISFDDSVGGGMNGGFPPAAEIRSE